MSELLKDDDIIGITNARYKQLKDIEEKYKRLQKWVKTMGIWSAFNKRQVR